MRPAQRGAPSAAIAAPRSVRGKKRACTRKRRNCRGYDAKHTQTTTNHPLTNANAPTSSEAVLACRLPSRLSGTPASSNVARSCCGDASRTTGFLSSEADSAYSHSRSAACFFLGCVVCVCRVRVFQEAVSTPAPQTRNWRARALSRSKTNTYLAKQHELLILLRRRDRHFFGLLGCGRPPACDLARRRAVRN